MYKQNLHIHTTYADGKDAPEELILEAIRQGFTSIGFSEHSYMPFSDYPHQMTVAQTEDYKKEIRTLKEKYRDKIGIFCGLELEFYSEFATGDFDYIIGSVHYLEVDGKIVGFGTWKDTGEIYGLYVLRDAQGYGIGRKLLDAMLTRLSNHEQSWLEVLEGNDRAIGFYKHMGFRLDGTSYLTRFSAVHPVLRMVRAV